MFFPSGDQIGWDSSEEVKVNRVCVASGKSSNQMSRSPWALTRSKATDSSVRR